MRVLIISLLLLPVIAMGQKKTDQRVFEEEMRYSREKGFNKWSIAVGGGLFWMLADETDYSFFPNRVNFSPSIVLSRQFIPSLALDLQLLQGNMYGNDRQHYFKGDIYEASVNATFYINQIPAVSGPVKDKWNFFAKAGAGLAMYRSRLFHADNDLIVAGSEFGVPTSGYMVTGYNTQNPDIKTARRVDIIVPVTAGVMYRINKSFDLTWEASFHFGTTDHMDNVLTGSSNDKPFFTGFHLSYKFGKKDRPHMRWTYRGYGFDIFGNIKKDPVETEVALLEDELAKYKDNRPVKTNIVVIHESLTTYYNTIFMRSIFFPKGEKKFDRDDMISMAEMTVKLMYKPEATLELYGYVNENAEGNHEETSRAQCEKIVDFLVNELGTDASRIKIKAMGSALPLVKGTAASPQIKETSDRRVDMVIVL